MTRRLFTNNATSTLAAGISSGATSLSLVPGGGSLFPNPATGYEFTATLVKSGSPTTEEIILVTARAGDVMTIVRGQESTTAVAWNAGDTFTMLPTAGDMAAMAQFDDLQAQGANYAIDTGAANAYVVGLTPAVTAHVLGMPIRWKAAHSSTAASMTFNDGAGAAPLIMPGAEVPVIIAGGLYTSIWDGAAFQTQTRGYGITAAELAASVVPTNFTIPPYYAQRYGYAADNNPASASANVTALNAAIAVAAAAVSGASGATVFLPVGIGYINNYIAMPNRVRLAGTNCSGSIIKATSGFGAGAIPAWNSGVSYTVGTLVNSGGNYFSCIASNLNQSPPNASYWNPWPLVMFWCANGVTAMFDSIFQDLFIDCSSVAGLGAILTDAWQENSGLRSVGIMNFTTFGLRYRNVNAGGQATSEIQQCQFFPANVAGVSAGIQIDKISIVGAFMVHVRDSVIAGNPANPCAIGINVVNDSLNIDNVHFEGCVDAIYAGSSAPSGVGSITAKHISGLAGITNLVHIDPGFTGRVNLIGCFRNGSTNLITNGVTGEVYTSPDLADYVYPEVVCQNTAKAWCVFNGTTTGTNAPTAGYNITNIQRNSAGNYSVHFSRNLTSANCAPVVSFNLGNATYITSLVNAGRIDIVISVAGVPTDSNEIKVVVFGL